MEIIMSHEPVHSKLGRLFHHRRYILYIPFMIMALGCFWMETENKIIVWSLGMGLMILGSLIRLWSVRYCGKRTVYKTAKGRRLTIYGPYAYIRNPLYISNLALGCGLIVLSKLLWLVPIFIIVGFFYYHLIALHEESRLLVYYGTDYENYCRNVGRWLPKFTKLNVDSNIAESKTNPWSDIFRAEYLRFLAVTCVIIIIIFKEYLASLT